MIETGQTGCADHVEEATLLDLGLHHHTLRGATWGGGEGGGRREGRERRGRGGSRVVGI